MLPSDALVKFILCDSAREEKDNKVSLLGVYPDDTVYLPADARFPAAFPLTLVYFLLDGEGAFSGAIELKTPIPQPPFSGPLPNIQKAAKQPGTILVSFTPFVAGGFGRYEAIMTLNNQRYTRTFTVAPAP
jgi:hypothetical protein